MVTRSIPLLVAVAVGLCAGHCGAVAVVTAARRDNGPQQRGEQETGQSLVVDRVDGQQHRTSGKGILAGTRFVHADYGYGVTDDGDRPPTDYYYYDGPPPPPPHQMDDVYRQHHDDRYYEADGGVRRPHYHQHGEPNVQPLLWPLAGITLLGVLSALVKTPLLLHLGHVGGRRRRRRNADVRLRTDKFDDTRGPRRQRACSVCEVLARVYGREESACAGPVCPPSRNRPPPPPPTAMDPRRSHGRQTAADDFGT